MYTCVIVRSACVPMTDIRHHCNISNVSHKIFAKLHETFPETHTTQQQCNVSVKNNQALCSDGYITVRQQTVNCVTPTL